MELYIPFLGITYASARPRSRAFFISHLASRPIVDAHGRIVLDQTRAGFRSYGNENCEFAANGLMQRRLASINDVPIQEAERKFDWHRSGPRPPDYKGLSDLAP